MKKEKEEKKKKKSRKKMSKLLIGIIVVVLCIISGLGTYFITYEIDKSKKGGDVKLTVTFDDTNTYVIPSIKKVSKDDALLEWPYIMNLQNKGTGNGLYQILLHDAKDSTIKREYLSYSLFLGDKELVSGELKDIQNDILYTSKIEGKSKQQYSLYIWVSKELPVKEETEAKEEQEEKKEEKYEYSLEFNTIKEGGPGF